MLFTYERYYALYKLYVMKMRIVTMTTIVTGGGGDNGVLRRASNRLYHVALCLELLSSLLIPVQRFLSNFSLPILLS